MNQITIGGRLVQVLSLLCLGAAILATLLGVLHMFYGWFFLQPTVAQIAELSANLPEGEVPVVRGFFPGMTRLFGWFAIAAVFYPFSLPFFAMLKTADVRKHIDFCGTMVAVMGVIVLMGGISTTAFSTFTFLTSGWLGGLLYFFLALVVYGLSVPYFMVNKGLYGRKKWARSGALALAAIHLLAFPFGTTFAGYALWSMLRKGSADEFI